MTEQQRQRFSAALARLANDESTLRMLAGMVAEDAPPMLARLAAYAAADETSEYAQTAHALKGLLSTFETGDPVSELQPIIEAAHAHDGQAVRQLHTKLTSEIESLLSEISAVAEVV